MAQMKIPGGAYQLPDGSWVNANGKAIAAPRGDVYDRAEAPAPALIPPAEKEAGPGSQDPEDEFAKPKRGRGKAGKE